MPASVRAVQVLLYVVAGLTALACAAALIDLGAGSLWRVTLFALPGITSLMLALCLARRVPAIWWAILALQALYIVLSLTVLIGGDPRGAVNLALPLLITVLMTRRGARDHFRR